jgi:hypothetical protein
MRLYTSQSEPLDFCRKCFPSEEEAKRLYANIGEGPDGRGNCFCYDDDHPDYSENRDMGYTCWFCKKKLGKRDNAWEQR